MTLTIFDTKENPEHTTGGFRILIKYPVADLWCDIEKMDPDYFLEVHNESSWGYDNELGQGKFQTDIKKKKSSIKMIKYFNELLSEFK